MSTPLRAALVVDSRLLPLIHDGVQALKREHRRMIADGIRDDFADSLELDEAVRVGNDQDNRWDYLLGHEPSRDVVGLEPHSAKNDEVSTVIRKRQAALDQLRDHLKSGKRVRHWFWVASGKVDFNPLEKATLRLADHGITFVGKALLAKHLLTTATRPAKHRLRK